MRRSHNARLLAYVLSAIMLALTLAPGGRALAMPAAQDGGRGTYENEILPVIPGNPKRVETFADPAIIQGKDGYYYAYATKDPRYDEDEFHVIPIVRSDDLVNWTYIGDAFPNGNPPSADPAAGIFAPDIRYFNGQYYLYFSITNVAGVTPGAGGDDSAIGVATSPTPYGPFTDHGIVVEPQKAPCCADFRATIDPHVLPLPDGRRLIYYGSYFGGLDVRELTPDGLRSVPATQQRIAIDNRYEAPYVIRRGDYYYIFASATDCCNFELTGYSVFAGRSTSPFGPFVDSRGDTFLESRVGGELVLAMNGNRFVGPGHNAVFTDLSGQDYIVYHAIDRFDPEVKPAPRFDFFINRRPLMLDRLDYIGGFPIARAGRGPSDRPQRAPVTRGRVDDEFNRAAAAGVGNSFRVRGGTWTISAPVDGGGNAGVARQGDAAARQALLLSRRSTPKHYRAEADVRLAQGQTAGRYGLVTSFSEIENHIVSYLEAGANGLGGSLVTRVRTEGEDEVVRTALPANFRHTDFHNIAVTVRSRAFRVEVTESRLQDPVAIQTRTLNPEAPREGRVGFFTSGASAEFDNLHAARLFKPVTKLVEERERGDRRERYSDEFNGNLDPENGWTYAQGRTPPEAGYGVDERRGYYRHLTDDTELFRDVNTARVLVEDAPKGNFTVETKLEFNLPGDGSNQAFAQAGLVLYQDDNNYVRLNHVAIFNTRQIEFYKETTGIFSGTNNQGPPRGRRDGGSVLTAPSDVTWLRITRTGGTRPGEQRYTAYSSVDGKHFEKGPTWTHNLRNLKIGITAFNKPGFTADFDYVRVYQR